MIALGTCAVVVYFIVWTVLEIDLNVLEYVYDMCVCARVFYIYSQRKPLEEAGMRAAFSLREAKEHEQQPLLEATLAATAMHPERKRSLDGMALSLQQANVTKIMKKTNNNNDNIAAAASTVGAADTTRNNTSPVQQSKQREELERQHRQREEARMERERDKKKKKVEEMEQNRKNESNSGGNTNALTQIFKMYWDMEFQLLQNTNPFRTVIDRQSAQYIAPGYFDVITTPMNLTWIKEKVQDRKYTTLTQFFGDIDLMIDNALKYNTQGPYRQASEELKKKHAKIVKSVWKQIKEKKSQHTTKS